MISFLAGATATSTCSIENESLLQVLSLVRTIVNYLQILIPIALILWGTIDLGKAVIAGDEKKIKEKYKPFIQRIIAAIVVFLIPFIVNLLINVIVPGNNEWKACWKEAGTKTFEGFETTVEGLKDSN